MVRNGVIANMLTRNQKKTCEARGIPPEVLKEAWDEYQHTAQYEGRYFHRLELAGVDSSSVPVGCTKMIEALKAHSLDGRKPLATIKRFGISKSSFYYALNWQKQNCQRSRYRLPYGT
jgi:hypothetical protein